jgi:Spy/CpxP family protein refolding chaperone
VIKQVQEVHMKKMYIVLSAGFFLALCITGFAMGPEVPDMGPRGFGEHQMVPLRPNPMNGPEPFKEPRPMDRLAKLHLSMEQMDNMWQLEENFHSDTRAIRYELFRKQLKLNASLVNPKVEDAVILAQQKEVDAARQKIDDKMVQFKLAQRKILTAEQLRKLGEGGFNSGCLEIIGRGPHGSMY